ncbi:MULTISPECIES: hypothetical protein [Pacificibacter]|uniref:hypothetical protein n=1 Tax=Pacificibacter TaxID=1042323 RepID=UPI001C09ECEE|nr:MULTISPECIES: hypothetical protein [Pacificibacter]MBU2934582.1 hypothetical protein [Pacificibacter marinus]MDO6616974.1 hypothetical protein [Pacificibacter sp. 1_MG-2023]
MKRIAPSINAESVAYLPAPIFLGGDVLQTGQTGDAAEHVFRDHPFAVNKAKNDQGTDQATYRCAGLADMAVAIATGRQQRGGLELTTYIR